MVGISYLFVFFLFVHLHDGSLQFGGTQLQWKVKCNENVIQK